MVEEALHERLTHLDTSYMALVINNPTEGRVVDSSGMGAVLGIIVAILAITLFLVYGLPAIRRGAAPASNPGANINVRLPSPNTGNNTPSPSPAPVTNP